METSYFGTLSMCRAFAPVLAAGGGAIFNMLSETKFRQLPPRSVVQRVEGGGRVADQRHPDGAVRSGHAGGRRARRLH
jgi:NAD(P)-dependent dehydrogenase (short-subunit alcohol dehydrogenase family)